MDWQITYPRELPISKIAAEIILAMQQQQVVIVVAETGSGKTTQLPKMLVDALQKINCAGAIVCTQPRRIAAVSVARRVAEETATVVGEEVGYSVRFDQKTSAKTVVEFATDGMVLARLVKDPWLKNYQGIIIDEVHERNLSMDFLLGYLKLVIQKRPKFRLVLSSATVDAEKFAAFFHGAPILSVAGRTYPVTTMYRPLPIHSKQLGEYLGAELNVVAQAVISACEWIAQQSSNGDVLVFLPGEKEIRVVQDKLQGAQLTNTQILPLFSRVSLAEQQKIFQQNKARKIILATNIAETSLTVPGIVYVIDTGLVKMSQWQSGQNIGRLELQAISQASAKQRAGRAGRVQPGVCIRLYGEEQYEGFASHTKPEIQRTSLAEVILKMLSLGLGPIEKFAFIDPPSLKNQQSGYRVLKEIGAIDGKKKLTTLGKKLIDFPLEPRLAATILASIHYQCCTEVLCLVSVLSISDPKQRPIAEEKEADRQHAQWQESTSDFINLLYLWQKLQPMLTVQGWHRNQLRKYAKQHYLHFLRLIEWQQVYQELADICRHTLQITIPKNLHLADLQNLNKQENIHKSLLVGLPTHVAMYDKQERHYRSCRNVALQIFPGSALFGQTKPACIFSYQIITTSQTWGRINAAIDPAWLVAAAPHLCQEKYYGAHWDARAGVVRGKKKVQCGNLILVAGQRIDYSRVDRETARQIFLQEALLQRDVKFNCTLFDVLDQMREEVDIIEHKLRRLGGIWSDEALLQWLDKHIPLTICTQKEFLQWWTSLEQEPALKLQDVILEDVGYWHLEQFPNEILHDDQSYPLYYRVTHDDWDDGLTIGVSLEQMADFPHWLASWGVVGYLQERVTNLLQCLNKQQRKKLHPIRQAAANFVQTYSDFKHLPTASLDETLSHWLELNYQLMITVDTWSQLDVPYSDLVKIWCYQEDGEEIAWSTDWNDLQQRVQDYLGQQQYVDMAKKWQLGLQKSWSFDEMPQVITYNNKRSYLALVDRKDGVDSQFFEFANEAEQHHSAGCNRLFLLANQDWIDDIVQSVVKKQQQKKKFVSNDWSQLSNQQATITCLAQQDRIRLALERAMRLGDWRNALPRSKEVFVQAAQYIKQYFYDFYQQISQQSLALQQVTGTINTTLLSWQNKLAYREIVRDFKEYMTYLQHANMVAKLTYQQWLAYRYWWQCLEQRVIAIKQQFVAKDISKIEQIDQYHHTWFSAWQKQPTDYQLVQQGQQLSHWRILLFAPESYKKYTRETGFKYNQK